MFFTGCKKIQNVGNGVNPSTAIITSLSASQSAVANATPTGMIRIPLTNTYQDEKYTLGYIDNFLYCLCNQYAKFSGRATRGEYWRFSLFQWFVLTAFSCFVAFIGMLTKSGIAALIVMYVFIGLYSLAIFVPSLAISIRRLHDVGETGWFLFLPLIPLVGSIWLLVLLCQKGQEGSNEYGEVVHTVDVRKEEEKVVGAKATSGSIVTIGLIVGALILSGLTGCFSAAGLVGSLSEFTEDVPTAHTVKSDINKDMPIPTEKTSESTIESSEENFASLISEKDSLDTQIGETASAINGYLTTHSSFQNASELKSRAVVLEERARNAKARTERLSGNEAERAALANLFQLEIDRIHGLYKGMVDNSNGGDYSLGFKDGTQASYAFDSANASFNQTYK